MKATRKYFFAVIGLMLLQIAMGAITAHYAVEGQAFFGIPLGQVLPYVVSRTVHTQVGVFWIATAWLATGLYIAPAISGHEPKYQKLGVNVLFYALLFIVVGSTATGWIGSVQHLGNDFSFWMLACRTTSAHLRRLACTVRRNCSGDSSRTVLPCASKRWAMCRKRRALRWSGAKEP